MTLYDALFYLNSLVVVGFAIAGLVTPSGERTRVACFLVSMSSLTGVFLLLGAPVIAIAQLLFTSGVGLIYLFVNDLMGGQDDEASALTAPASWNWLVVVLGTLGAGAVGSRLFSVITSSADVTHAIAATTGGTSFAQLGYTVLVDNGIAVLGVAMLLLASLVGSGFLARRGLD
ncbi:MAG: NADH:ubiquinone oxidoreductase subunit 6 (subunit J) [Myxococcota bacterium]|jgi:NADH:ubiquinone oxidoreductase subunit 6 (subunit J)